VAYAPRDLIHNWRLKVSALALSFFLWALVQSEPQNAESFTVPVIVDVADTAWTTSGVPEPASIELRMTGPPRQMIRLAREGTAVRIPLRDVSSADTFVTLRRDWVWLGEGSGLAVESMSPLGVRVALERAVNRVVPVAVITKGMLPSHLSLASPIGLNPPVVRARGATSRLEGLDSVRLTPLDLSRVEASGIFELAVDTLGHQGVRFIPATVTVGIRVEEEIERVVTGVPVVGESGAGEAPIVIRPSAIDVTLRGARTLVNAVDPTDLRAWIAPELVRGIAPGEARRVPVQVDGVPDLVTFEVQNDIVTVRLASDANGIRPPGDGA
jgi:YbbR domain-containing protein